MKQAASPILTAIWAVVLTLTVFGLPPAAQANNNPGEIALAVRGRSPDALDSVRLTVQNAANANGVTYYVAKTGSDSNPGTLAQPWLTIQKAANTVAAGDTVIVTAGIYAERVMVSSSGASGSPIVFQAQGVVEVGGFVLTGDYLQVKAFTVRVFTCTNTNYGINVSGDYFVVEDNRVIEMVDGGLRTAPASSGGVIRNNYFYHNITTAIELHGANHLVEGNEIKRPIETHPTCATPANDANGVWFFGSGHVLRNNTIHEVWYGQYIVHGHLDCFQTFGGWESGDPARNTNILIENNFCDAYSYQGPDESGSGFTVEDVSSSDGTYEHGVIFRNNVVISVGCVGAQENTAYLSVVNNTCINGPQYRSLYAGLEFWPGTTYDNHHYNIQNNIFYDYSDPIYVNTQVLNGGTVTTSRNLAYMTNGGAPVSTAFTCGQDNNVCADPLFVDTANLIAGDYHLSAGSPAIDAGEHLGALVTADVEGVTRPQAGGYDIGAYEVMSGQQTPRAIFGGSPISGAEPLTVNFTDHSGGQPTSWAWDFGDGANATAQNPTHQYVTAGYYPVSLTAANGLGQNTKIKTQYITVRPAGTPNTLFTDGFETALSWATVGNVTWYTGSPRRGTYSVQLKKTGSVQKTISASGYRFITVSFYMGAYSLETEESFQALWYDGSVWTVIKAISDGDAGENNQLNYYQFQMPATADNNGSFGLWFKLNGNATNDYGYVDDVMVTGFSLGASTPTPTSTPLPPTATPTSTPLSSTATLTSTPVPSTSTPTSTPLPPTATPTSTPVSPTATPTSTPVSPTATPTPASSPQRIFLDDFEAAFSGWSPSGGTITWYTGSPRNGTHSIRMSGNGPWMYRTISTVGYHGIVVRVYLGAESYEASEALKLFWWNGSWVKLKSIVNGSPEEDGQLHYLEFALSSQANNTVTFKLAFNQQSSDASDYGYIDDVEVWGTAN